MLKSPLFWKIVTLGGAMLLLLIPLTMVRQIIVERSDYRNDVEDAIRQSTSGPQKMVGPLIAIPVTELYTSLEDGKEIQRKRSYIHFWLPESLVVEGSQNVEARKIGIYEGQVWHNDLSVKAEFNAERLRDLNHPNVSVGKPWGMRAGLVWCKRRRSMERRWRLSRGRGWMDVRRGSTFRYPTRAGRSKT